MPNEPPRGPSDYSRQKRLREVVLAGLGFIALPDLAVAFAGAARLPPDAGLFAYAGQTAALLAFLLHALPRGLRDCLRPPRPADPAWALGLAAALFALFAAVSAVLPHAGGALPFARPGGPLAWLSVAFVVLLAAANEELLYRVYLLDRLASLGLAPAAALAVSAPLFALGHFYEGAAGVAFAGAAGVLFGLAWQRRRSFLVNWLGHALYNLAMIVLYFSFAKA